MPTTRIPPAPMSGLLGRLVVAYARRTYGQVPDNAPVFWHHRPVLRSVLAFERRVARWSRRDPHLKTYTVMASAAVIGCASTRSPVRSSKRCSVMRTHGDGALS